MVVFNYLANLGDQLTDLMSLEQHQTRQSGIERGMTLKYYPQSQHHFRHHHCLPADPGKCIYCNHSTLLLILLELLFNLTEVSLCESNLDFEDQLFEKVSNSDPSLYFPTKRLNLLIQTTCTPFQSSDNYSRLPLLAKGVLTFAEQLGGPLGTTSGSSLGSH